MCAATCRAACDWRELADSSLNWGSEGAGRGPAPSLYPPADQLRKTNLLSQDFFKYYQGKVRKKSFTEKLENIDGKNGHVGASCQYDAVTDPSHGTQRGAHNVSFRRITPSSPHPSPQGAPTAQPPAVLDGPPHLRQPRRPLMARLRAQHTSAGHPRVPGTFVSAVLLSRAGTPRCGA